MSKKNVTQRIGEEFSKELEEIQEQRLDLRIDKKKKSFRRLTNLIVKHSDWKKIKKDTIEIELENVK